MHAGYSAFIVWGGIALYVAGIAAAGIWASRDTGATSPTSPSTEPTPLWSFPLVGIIVVGVAYLFARWGLSIYTHDSWAQYSVTSWALHDSGTAVIRLVRDRQLMLPAMQAAYHFFGGEWAGTLYPVISALIVAWVAVATSVALWTRRIARFLVPGLLAVVMVADPTYLFMSGYMHSHSTTALMILIAVVALWRTVAEETSPRPWLLVAGIALAGIWLARPDGPAYGVAVLFTALAIMMRSKADWRDFGLLVVPTLGVAGLYVLATIVQLGMWDSHKVSASLLLLFLGGYALVWPLLVWARPQRWEWACRAFNLPALALGLQSVALVWFVRTQGEQGANSVSNMLQNLFVEGGWRSFWVVAISATAVILLFRTRYNRSGFSAYCLYAVVQFMLIAVVIHAAQHPGRVGWGDSFNRVAFHVVPVLYFAVGMYVAELLRNFERADEGAVTTGE